MTASSGAAESALLLRQAARELLEDFRFIEPCGKLTGAPQRAPLAHDTRGKRERGRLEFARHTLIEESQPQRLGERLGPCPRRSW